MTRAATAGAAFAFALAAAACLVEPFGQTCVPGTDEGDCQFGPGTAAHKCATFADAGSFCVLCVDGRDYETLRPRPSGEVSPIDRRCDATEPLDVDQSGSAPDTVPWVVVENTSLSVAAHTDLVAVDGDVVFVDNDALEAIRLPELRRIGGRLLIAHNLSLGELELTALESVDGGVFVVDNGSPVEQSCADLFAARAPCGGACECRGEIPPDLLEAGF